MRTLLSAVLALGLMPGLAGALELKNVRPSYGPLGAYRTDLKCLPGDVLFLTYDIEGLTFDKTGKASYLTTLELVDSGNKVIFKKDTPNEVVAQLGGTRMPGDLHVIMSPKQAAGKYSIRLTVQDKVANQAKAFKYDFEVVPESFGFIGVSAPAVGFPGQQYISTFALVNMGLDAKKQPNVDVTMRVLDDKGSPVAKAMTLSLPAAIPEGVDIQKENFVPLNYPLYLNRVGTFQIDVVAVDKMSNKQVQLRYPLTVIDITSIAGR